VQIHKATKLRAYPNKAQSGLLNRHFGCARFVYNHFLSYKTQQYKETGKSANFIQMSKELTRLKNLEEYLWLGEVSRQSLAYSLAGLDRAFNNFFKKHTKYPKFKSKHRKQSFSIGSPFCKVRVNGIHLPLLGVIKCNINSLPANYKLLSATISRSPSGKIFIALNIQTDISDPITDISKSTVGLDFGLKTFITTSSGVKYEHPKPNKKYQLKLAREQRALARKKNASKRRFKQKQKVGRIYERTSNIRHDFLHKLSRKLVGENQAIYVEDLNLEGMKARFGQSVSDLGWAEFIRQLTYKGIWYGCEIKKIDRFFPSSKTCSKCGWINESLSLKNRIWECPICLTEHDRDINAAVNVLEYGRADRNLRTGRVIALDELCSLKR
jgi:putative transposase